ARVSAISMISRKSLSACSSRNFASCQRTAMGRGACLNDSGVLLTLPHETVLGGAGELLTLRTHNLWRACLPFTFFEEAVGRRASQGLAILATRFACARFLRHYRADRQGRNHCSEENSLHGLSPVQ